MGLIQAIKNKLAKPALLLGVLGAVFMFSSCVSDTLSTVDTQPPAPTIAQIQAENPKLDPYQRQRAITEIRDKQNSEGSGELTNAFAGGNGPNEPYTKEQSAAKIEALQKNAVQNDNTLGDAELASKQARIKELQHKAKTHYNSAVNSIQN